ncbi:hypothetical protein SAMN02799636_04966 [Methylobacterium sp. 275MFSha3.1]|uniref:Dyp-type peroxidase n=1 Tax=Methylobacterium sp. 275MFSha3.1 TaxID=1502746 RepID=UPI0008A75808|nr:hypothetical protein [Methylobacterium sp. 275MFSha3.1]SEI01797.1 hypothetical protein SAMN02799636_04966 [Methylobacterium sp. 275MFSha3.1]
MAVGTVETADTLCAPPNWKLAEPIRGRTQGLIASGFGHLPYGRALFLEFVWPAETRGGAWLNALAAKVTVTHGAPDEKDEKPPQAASLAFTWTGLRRMGLGKQALASFSRPFREGMFQEDRMRRLGDCRAGAWLKSVVEGGPRWSANTPRRDPTRDEAKPVGGYAVPHAAPAEMEVKTSVTVHALLLLYTKEEPAADGWALQVKQLLGNVGVDVVHELDLLLDVEKKGISREHFGFADALSQPIPFGLNVPVDETKLVLIDQQPMQKDEVHGIPLGEILFGYQNGHSEPAPGPVVPRQIDGDPAQEDPRPKQADLLDHPQAEGFADLGIDGSYLVVRELKQDVAAFWRSLDEQAARIRTADPDADHVTAIWLAERIVGRSLDGHMLCPGGGYHPADKYGLPDSSFLFAKIDPQARGCPPGSHVRRAFPRDALAPSPTEDSRREMLQAANNHRILRRGRKFGPRFMVDRRADTEDRGLLFMCLNTDIERQFEFIQQTWLLNCSFATLFDEVDPLLGPAGKQTIRDGPLRRKIDVETYVRMAGGDYFFLPSMPAIKYLSLL